MTWALNFKIRITYVLGAVVAGAINDALLGWTRNSGDVHAADFKKALVVSALCYFVTAAVICLTGKPRVVKVPIWVLIPLFASILSFTLIVLVPNELETWQPVSQTIIDVVFSLFIDGVIALPIMGLFHLIVVRFLRTTQ
jgi:hypothetical protein